jgi:hypothetical protein
VRARRDPILVGAVLVAAAALGALALVFTIWGQTEETSATPPQAASGIEAQASFSPRVALFGDTVHARVDLTLDTSRVDPDSIRVAADFTPWRAVGTPERVRREVGSTAYVQTTYVLRCLTGSCVVSGQSARLEFPPARVAFTAPGGQSAGESPVRVAWPTLLVYPRFTSASVQGEGTSSPWRADLLTLPAATHRVAPVALIALLLSGAALALLAAVGLAYVAWPRRAAPPPPAPEPQPPPEPVLTPLEQALVLLEESVRLDGASDQRRALELVAEELELAAWGDPDLARTARVLAWSEGVPRVTDTSNLAARVRSAIEESNQSRVNGDGHVA